MTPAVCVNAAAAAFFFIRKLSHSHQLVCQAKEKMVPLAIRKYFFLSIQSKKKMNSYWSLWLRFGSIRIFFIFLFLLFMPNS